MNHAFRNSMARTLWKTAPYNAGSDRPLEYHPIAPKGLISGWLSTRVPPYLYLWVCNRLTCNPLASDSTTSLGVDHPVICKTERRVVASPQPRR